jgi:dTDP-4-dehydrorhamnose 3,5-epimerase
LFCGNPTLTVCDTFQTSDLQALALLQDLNKGGCFRKGRVLDVAVDIRKGSPTYGKHVAVELTEDNHVQFFIPKGFAHGFAVLSETAVFQYKCDNFYHPEADGGISILDDTLGIDWKIPTEHANLSEKDTKHAMLKDFESPFDINVDLYK